MRKNIEKVIEVIKEQVNMFLLDAGEFYPFGTCIDKENQIRPVSAFLEDDLLSPLELISMLENGFRIGVSNGEYKIAVLVVDVKIKKNNIDYDAIELRIFEPDNIETKDYIRYIVHNSHIEFIHE